nr:MAG TPA: hypothetical protein [Bacteriophage sp.]
MDYNRSNIYKGDIDIVIILDISFLFNLSINSIFLFFYCKSFFRIFIFLY